MVNHCLQLRRLWIIDPWAKTMNSMSNGWIIHHLKTHGSLNSNCEIQCLYYWPSTKHSTQITINITNQSNHRSAHRPTPVNRRVRISVAALPSLWRNASRSANLKDSPLTIITILSRTINGFNNSDPGRQSRPEAAFHPFPQVQT